MASIRIDIITSDEREAIVCLSGRLTEGEAFQLKKACNSIGKRFSLDLSDLLFADDTGINLLQELKKNGAEHRGTSPFIQMLLDRSPMKKND